MSGWKRLLEEESEHQWLSFVLFAIFIIIGGLMVDWSNELSGVRDGASVSANGMVIDVAGDAVLNMQDDGLYVDLGDSSIQKENATCLAKHVHITFACFGEEGLIHFHEDEWEHDGAWAAMYLGQDYTTTDLSVNGDAILLIIQNGMTHSFAGFWINGLEDASNQSQMSDDIIINSVIPTENGWLAGGSWMAPSSWIGGNPASPPMYELVVEITWDGINSPDTKIIHLGDEGEIHTMLGSDGVYFAAGSSDTVRIDHSGISSIGLASTAAAMDTNSDVWLFGEIGSSTVAIISDGNAEIEKLPYAMSIQPTYASIDDSGVISIHGIDAQDSPSAISIDPEERLSFTSMRGLIDLGFIFTSLLILGMMGWNIADALRKGEVF
ncbi:MAG: hypothetical protein QGI21_00565 [Candidatus Poseidoniaceae archaeon]|jgi:hypothetical protein|nr:hypothetical protein [Candidatus Poseidoniaceae archaeon]